jgi:hypothetical protein
VISWFSSGGFLPAVFGPPLDFPRAGFFRGRAGCACCLRMSSGRFWPRELSAQKRGSKIMKNLKIPPPANFRQSAKNDQF